MQKMELAQCDKCTHKHEKGRTRTLLFDTIAVRNRRRLRGPFRSA